MSYPTIQRAQLLGTYLILLVASDSGASAQEADATVFVTPAPLLPIEPVPSEASTPVAAAEQPDGVAGWYADKGFAIKSRDGNYLLHVGLQGGYRFQPYWRDGEAQSRGSFFVLRPILEGHIFRKWIRFWTSFEFARNPAYLLDSYVEIQPADEFGLRIGQQFTPLSRHEYVGPQQLLFPDWSRVADLFWTGRDKGVTALGSVLGGKLDYFAGIYSGSPLRQFTVPAGTWVTIARLTVSPLGPAATNEIPYITSKESVPLRFSMTLQGAAGDYAITSANLNQNSFTLDSDDTGVRKKQQTGSLDLWLQGPRFTLLSEFYVRRTDETDAGSAFLARGLWGQLGYMVWDRHMDLGARFNWLDASDELDDDRGYTLEGQLGYYPLQSLNLVARARYGYGKQQRPGVDAAPATLLLPEGNNHLFTLQLMLAI